MTIGDENWTRPATKVRRRIEVTIETASLAAAMGYPAEAKIHLEGDQIRIVWEDGPEPAKAPVDTPKMEDHLSVAPYGGKIMPGFRFRLAPNSRDPGGEVVVRAGHPYDGEIHFEHEGDGTMEIMTAAEFRDRATLITEGVFRDRATLITEGVIRDRATLITEGV